MLPQQLLIPTYPSAATYGQAVAAIPNLLAYWPLTETSGSTANDLSGGGRNLTYFGGVTLNSVAGPGPTMGNAPALDGVANSWIGISGATSTFAGQFNFDEYTVAMWIKAAAGFWNTTSGLVLLRLSEAAPVFQNEEVRIEHDSVANQIVFYGRTSGGAYVSKPAAVGTPTTWQHFLVSGSRSGNAFDAWWNGAALGAIAMSTPTTNGYTTQFLSLGAAANGGSLNFPGNMAHVVIYNRALTSAEKLTLATAA